MVSGARLRREANMEVGAVKRRTALMAQARWCVIGQSALIRRLDSDRHEGRLRFDHEVRNATDGDRGAAGRGTGQGDAVIDVGRERVCVRARGSGVRVARHHGS